MSSTAVSSIAVEADGHILAGGQTIGPQSGNRIARFNSDGTLSEFNVNTAINSIAIQQNGNFLVSGNFTTIAGQVCGRVARFGGVSISGRVTTPNGLGLRNATVILTDPFGTRRAATTSSFGLYQFDGVMTGQTYTLSVSSKRYRFAPIVRCVDASLTNIDFVGLE